jgi:glycosyltransferase involved in cell wall biosynthesis
VIGHTQHVRSIGCISFVVPAWNEEAHLAATLTCIREAAQSLGERFEVVVANDGSTDRTRHIAEQLADRTVHVHHRQIAATRNAGARIAQGDLLEFVDADTLVTGDLLRAVVRAVRQGAVGGGCFARFDEPVALWGALAVVLANAYNRLFRVAYGCFLFCTREAFDAVGGFDPSLYITEEVTMSQALRRLGRFVVLPHWVVTSGRKTRALTLRKALPTAFRAVFHGFHSRRGKELWYEERYKLSPGKPNESAAQQGGHAMATVNSKVVERPPSVS